MLDVVKGLIATAEKNGVKLILPTDIVVAPAFAADATPTLVAADAIPTDQMGLDIGPVSAQAFAAEIVKCKQCSGMAQWECLNSLTLQLEQKLLHRL